MSRIVGALAAAWLAGCGSITERPPNFVVILCDNLGYGDTEPFGSDLHRTPSLNRMAREGRKLTHFYSSAGVCTPSRASLMTGCYAQRVGLHTNPRDGHVLRPVSPYGINQDETTIAESLASRGYSTAIIGKWHLGDQAPYLPTRHGFDSYFGIPYSDDMTRDRGQTVERFDGNLWPPLPLMEDERVIEAPADRNLLTRRYTERALSYIEENRQRPFFLFLSHAMPGSERVPFASESFLGKSRNGAWGDAVEELDWSTGLILDKLVETGLDKRTLVLWTSDNGAPLAQDVRSPTRGSNRPFHGRGYTTAEGAFRVPAIVWWPGTVPAGTESSEIMSVLDLLPTLSGLAGAGLEPDRPIDGLDVADAMLGRGAARSPRTSIYFYQQDELQAVRVREWKLFLPLDSPGTRHPHADRLEPGEPLLFNLVQDDSSRFDRAGERPDVVQRLLRMAEEARGVLGDRGVRGSGQRDPGYMSEPKPQVTGE